MMLHRRAGILQTLLWVATVVVSVDVADAQPMRRPSDDGALVEKNKITFFLPLPYERVKAPASPAPGYFVWRVIVETLQPFSLVVMSDTVLRTTKPADVMRASRVRLCADPVVVSARACVAPISAKLQVAADHFQIILEDAELVARVRRERPNHYRRYMVEPGGRFLQMRHPFAHQVFERP